jgi:hypothetical protein
MKKDKKPFVKILAKSGSGENYEFHKPDNWKYEIWTRFNFNGEDLEVFDVKKDGQPFTRDF